MSMKAVLPVAPPHYASSDRIRHRESSGRVAALVALTKPRIAVMVLFTVAVGFVLGARGSALPMTFGLTLLGTGLVAASASAWNQVVERDRDALMRRTIHRPIPSGLIQPREAALFATALGVMGLVMLACGANLVAAGVAALTFALYVAVYTPLKPVTTLNTAIGAIPGALPPVIGWAAATGSLGIESFTLFLIVFLWQFPHFLAIAWIYRDDYLRGGHKMLPAVDPDGVLTARQSIAHALVLVPAGLLPTVVGVAGGYYFVGALLAGLYYLGAACRLFQGGELTDRNARRLLRASFLYLPVVLLLLLLNPMPA